MIFTFVYEYGVEVAEGTGLVFKALPIAFSKMGFAGVIISVLFFLGLAFAGITSTISLLEPSVMYFVQKHNKERKTTTWLIVLAIYIVGLILIFSLYKDSAVNLSVFGKALFVWVDAASSSVIMPFGALLSVIFIGYVVGEERIRLMTKSFLSDRMFRLWFFIIRYVAPLVVLIAWIGVILESS